MLVSTRPKLRTNLLANNTMRQLEADALKIARRWANNLQDIDDFDSMQRKHVHTRLRPELEVSVSLHRNQREIL